MELPEPCLLTRFTHVFTYLPTNFSARVIFTYHLTLFINTSFSISTLIISRAMSTDMLLYSIALSILVIFIFNLLNRRKRIGGRPLPPGPSPWPIIGNLPHMGPVPHHALAALARKHGPLMHLRLGFVDVIVAASASVASQFLKVHDANFSSRPPNSGAKYIAYNYQDLVFRPYGARWRQLRKISSVHLFSGKALDDYRYVRQVHLFIITYLFIYIFKYA